MKLERDKLYHFVAGFGIAVVVAVAALYCGAEHLSLALGLAASGLVGWAKEYVYDAKRPGKHVVDRLDFLWTFAGGIVGTAVVGVYNF